MQAIVKTNMIATFNTAETDSKFVIETEKQVNRIELDRRQAGILRIALEAFERKLEDRTAAMKGETK